MCIFCITKNFFSQIWLVDQAQLSFCGSISNSSTHCLTRLTQTTRAWPRRRTTGGRSSVSSTHNRWKSRCWKISKSNMIFGQIKGDIIFQDQFTPSQWNIKSMNGDCITNKFGLNRRLSSLGFRTHQDNKLRNLTPCHFNGIRNWNILQFSFYPAFWPS